MIIITYDLIFDKFSHVKIQLKYKSLLIRFNLSKKLTERNFNYYFHDRFKYV